MQVKKSMSPCDGEEQGKQLFSDKVNHWEWVSCQHWQWLVDENFNVKAGDLGGAIYCSLEIPCLGVGSLIAAHVSEN